MRSKAVIFFATAGFTGRIPIFGGTLGTIIGALLSLIFSSSLWIKGAVLIILLVSGIKVAGWAEKILGIKDDHSIVIDEVIGAVTASFFLPSHFRLWLSSLIIFKLFDWLKPFPIRRIEKLPGGFGIVLDDVVAGLYSLAIVWGIEHGIFN